MTWPPKVRLQTILKRLSLASQGQARLYPSASFAASALLWLGLRVRSQNTLKWLSLASQGQAGPYPSASLAASALMWLGLRVRSHKHTQDGLFGLLAFQTVLHTALVLYWARVIH